MPLISQIESFAFEPKDVKRGSLFFAKNSIEAYTALEFNAYGVVFEGSLQTIETESALIKVDSVEGAILRFLRFYLLDKEFEIYLVTSMEIEILRAFSKDSSIKIRESLPRFAKEILEAKDGDIFVSQNQKELETIYKNYKTQKVELLVPIKETLFDMSFLFMDRLYKTNLSPLFLPELQRALFLLKDRNIKENPSIELSHFRDIFVNRYLKIVQNSESILIFESDAELFLREMEFLKLKAKWARLLFFAPFDEKLQNSELNFYQKEQEVLDILRARKFNFTLILGNEDIFRELLETANSQTKQQTLLF